MEHIITIVAIATSFFAVIWVRNKQTIVDLKFKQRNEILQAYESYLKETHIIQTEINAICYPVYLGDESPRTLPERKKNITELAIKIDQLAAKLRSAKHKALISGDDIHLYKGKTCNTLLEEHASKLIEIIDLGGNLHRTSTPYSDFAQLNHDLIYTHLDNLSASIKQLKKILDSDIEDTSLIFGK